MTNGMVGTTARSRHLSWVLNLVALLMLGFIQWLCSLQGVPFVSLVRDPAAHLNAAPYVGLLSNLGCVGWGFAAGISAFGWVLLRRSFPHRELANLLGSLALLTALLGLDDLAQLHEDFFPRFHLSEKVTLSIYALLALAWLWRFRTLLMAKVRTPLLMAVGFFVFSVIADQLPAWGGSQHHLLEDGTKLMGILNWALMATRLSGSALVPGDGAKVPLHEGETHDSAGS